MQSLHFTSCIASNQDYIWTNVLTYLNQRLTQPIPFASDLAWQQRYQALDAGEIQLAAICGAPYVRRRALPAPTIELLAAPVWRAPRYQTRPVYFSDVIVHKDSHFQTFADLASASFVFNEPGSFSGYEAMRYHLASHALDGSYFAKTVQSGSHAGSIQMILTRQADCAAIDSTMFEQELANQPEIAANLRVVEQIGPSPMLPWVVSTTVDGELRARIQQALITLHQDQAGADLLASTPVSHFAPVTDVDYDSIRKMLALAATVQFNV